MKKIFPDLLFALIFCAIACKGRDTESSSGEAVNSTETTAYEENDFLGIKQLPPAFREWFEFYSSLDSGFAIHNFKASGVLIHLDSLPNATSGTNEANYGALLAYSPDSTRFIDFLSYNQHVQQVGAVWYISPGDPDQEVKLVDKKQKRYSQLLFYGPSQAVETAAWLNNNDFILGIMSLNDSSTAWIPEIYLFNLKDSSFTNFRFTRSISVDSIVLKDKNFFEAYFKKRNFIMR
jgi:hypothetical protein